jgi:hypothetical protein
MKEIYIMPTYIHAFVSLSEYVASWYSTLVCNFKLYNTLPEQS